MTSSQKRKFLFGYGILALGVFILVMLPRNPVKQETNKGLNNIAQGNNEQALIHFSNAIDLDPQNSEMYINRGNTYRVLEDYEMAIQDYSAAIELDPKSASVYQSRGFSFYMTLQFENAIEDFTKAIELDPKISDLYMQRGLAYADSGQSDLALADLLYFLELEPNSAYKERVENLINELN